MRLQHGSRITGEGTRGPGDLTPRKPGRPPHICACGETAFVRLTGPWTAVVDADDMPLFERGRWTACINKAGDPYAGRTESGKKVYLHKVILPVGEGMVPDHQNRNTLDCRRRNLRSATHSQNQMNSEGRPRKRKSKYKGVARRNDRDKWCATIRAEKKKIFIGYYDTEEAAAKAYDAKAIELHKEFAFLNFKEKVA